MKIVCSGSRFVLNLALLTPLVLLPRVLAQSLASPPSITADELDDSPRIIFAQMKAQTSTQTEGDDLDEALQAVSQASLPDSPGWTLPTPPRPMLPCPAVTALHPATPPDPAQPCIHISPYRRFLDANTPIPLTPKEKGYLALHNFKDPGNIITIVGTAAFTIGANAHTAYGPGLKGFGRNTGYSFSQDATGEFFGTFLIPSLLHEDPHYHREPKATVPHRILHAISRTVIAQHDDGRMMPNYAVLFTYPISAEISNLYVPGINGSGASTAKRIVTGLATDPASNIITEFLPDIARRINIRAIFVQRLLNAVTAGSNGGSAVAGP